MKRGALILLVVSLVLNLFLLGAIGGSLWRWTHGRPAVVGWRAHAADGLPTATADRFRQSMRATALALRPVTRAGREARGRAAMLFEAPSFDPRAVMAELDRARAADIAVRTRLERQVVAFATTLPADQRRTLGQGLRSGPLRQPLHRGRKP